MNLAGHISKSNITMQKIHAINLDTKDILSELKKHKGRAKLSISIGQEDDEENTYFLIDLDYEFIYNKLPCSIEMGLNCRVDLDIKLEKNDVKGVNSIINKLTPDFDEEINKVNEIMGTKIPSLSKIQSRSKSDSNKLKSNKSKSKGIENAN